MKKLAFLIATLAISTTAVATAVPTPATDPVNAHVHAEKKHIHSDIIISDQWMRLPTQTSVNTAAYFNIHNGSDIDVKIIGAMVEKGVCKTTEIHGYKPDDKGVMKMFKLESITIPAKTTVEFKPGSNHVMLMGLEKTLLKDSHYNIEFKIVPANDENKTIIPDFVIKFPVK